MFSCSFGSIYEAIFFPRCDLSVRTSNKTPEFHGRINHSHNLCGIDIKKRLQRRCFSVNIVKCLRTLFYRIPQVTASLESYGIWTDSGRD